MNHILYLLILFLGIYFIISIFKKIKTQTLKKLYKNIADGTGYEKLEQKIENEYAEILRKISLKANNGFYRYYNNDYMNNHENEILLNGVCKKLRKEGFHAYNCSYGYTHRELVITWK